MISLHVLGECLACLSKDALSLRLHSRLSLGLVHCMLLHFRALLADAQKLLKKTEQLAVEPPRSYLAAVSQITQPVRLGMLGTLQIFQAPVPSAGDDTIEHARGHSSMLFNLSYAFSSLGPELLKRKADRVDKHIDIHLRFIEVPAKRRKTTFMAKLGQDILSLCFASAQDCCLYSDMEMDISSIEIPRQHSSSLLGYPNKISLSTLQDAQENLSTHSVSLSAAAGVRAPSKALSFFLSVLSGVTEGRVCAYQLEWYGTIHTQAEKAVGMESGGCGDGE
ncbi:hypothetical protein NECID01_0835 [Nematocida sp. AWRm77]|nr:hypothetical protein NECID01_0835 [Nematocida sp. AWRm77]